MDLNPTPYLDPRLPMRFSFQPLQLPRIGCEWSSLLGVHNIDLWEPDASELGGFDILRSFGSGLAEVRAVNGLLPVRLVTQEAAESYFEGRGFSARGVCAADAVSFGFFPLISEPSVIFRRFFGGELARMTLGRGVDYFSDGVAQSANWSILPGFTPMEGLDACYYFELSEMAVVGAWLNLNRTDRRELGTAHPPPRNTLLLFSMPGEPRCVEIECFDDGARIWRAGLFRGRHKKTEDGLPKRQQQRVDEVFRLRAALKLGLRDDEFDPTPLARRILNVYLELVRWAENHREEVLARIGRRDELQTAYWRQTKIVKSVASSYTRLGSDLEGLPAHFALLPPELIYPLRPERVRGRLAVPLQRPRAQLRPFIDLSLPFHGNADRTIERVNWLFGRRGGPRWLVAQGLVSLAKLFGSKVGYDRCDAVHRLSLADWCCAMRPHKAKRIRAKGTGVTFGPRYDPWELFLALFDVLEGLTYRYENSNGSRVDVCGFVHRYAQSLDERWVEYSFNRHRIDRIVEPSKRMFMIINTDAMFSWQHKSLLYGPAAQLGLELLAHSVLHSQDTSVLETIQGDRLTRRILMDAFGFVQGSNESPSVLLKRLDRLLNQMTDFGVLQEWSVDHHSSPEGALDDPLRLVMNFNYQGIYSRPRLKRELEEAELSLQIIF